MRIISGEKRGSLLFGPKTTSIRPTTDRAKEALFNIINFGISDTIFLDLFTGSGAIAFEAKSRGAREVYAVDKSLESKELVQRNLEKVKLDINFIYKDVNMYLNTTMNKYNIIFLDPPFNKTEDEITNIINTVYKRNLLLENGYIVVERATQKENENFTKYYDNVKIKKYGKVSFIIIGKV